MPQYVALKTFLRNNDQFRQGAIYTLPASDGRDLQQNGLVRPVVERNAPQNTAHTEAPRTAGEDLAPDVGAEPPSSALHRGPRSRRKTARTSKGERE